MSRELATMTGAEKNARILALTQQVAALKDERNDLKMKADDAESQLLELQEMGRQLSSDE